MLDVVKGINYRMQYPFVSLSRLVLSISAMPTKCTTPYSDNYEFILCTL